MTWKVQPTTDAAADIRHILRWTRKEFGEQQERAYRVTLRAALKALHSGPNIIGVKKRDDLAPGMFTLHVARNGRKGSHFIVFRISESHTIDVLRLLHDGMDLAAHLPE